MVAAGASLALLVALFLALWLLSRRLSDVGVVDIVWGPGFAAVAWLEWLWLAPAHPSATVLLLAVTLWAARLGAYLFARHRRSQGEDARYAAMRAADGPAFALTSLWRVFLLQAAILWGLALPIHLAMLGEAGEAGPLTSIGLGLFAAGFALEAIADSQIMAFKHDPKNKGKLFTAGLYAWSRHPNYFGESVLWFGLGLIAWDASGSAFVLLGPLALTVLLLKVSGVPLLEAHLARTRPGYGDYAARTSAFVPWPPRRPSVRT